MLKTLWSLTPQGSSAGLVTKLCNRNVVLIEGTDTYSFLNGMVTNKIESNSETDCIYGAFLNGKGRVLGDALFYHRPSLRSYLIELSTSHSAQIVQHLQSFKMRKKVYFDHEFTNANDLYSILAATPEWRDRIVRNLLNRGDLGNTMNIYIDPRWELSIRVIVPKGVQLPLQGVPLVWAEPGQQREYDYLRMMNGIAEGQREMPYEKQIPLEANIQNMHGIHFEKELVARTHFTGQLRKRILPLRRKLPYVESSQDVIRCSTKSLIPDGFIRGIAELEDTAPSLIGKNIMSGENVTGTVLNGHYNVVMGVVRMEHLKEKNKFSIDGTVLLPGETDSGCWEVMIPHWWQRPTE